MTNDRQRILPIEDEDLLLATKSPTQPIASPIARVQRAVSAVSQDDVDITIRNTVVPTALLLYIRWLDSAEQEREAMAAFDGQPYMSTLPEGMLWRNWSELRGRDLTGFISRTLLPSLGSTDISPFAARIRQLDPIQDALLRLPEALRDELLNVVDSLPWRNSSDWLAAETLLAEMIRLGATKRSGFYLPEEAVELVLEIAQPQPGERVYDPCFGSGSLLAGAARRLREGSKRLSPSRWEELRSNSIFGVEINPLAYFVGMVRVILSGIDKPGLELGNALDRPLIKNLGAEGFDCVIANPPWRAIVRTARDSSFAIQASSSEGLFIQLIASSLRAGGRAVVALPVSFLSRSGPEMRVRKYLLERFQVEGVIALPPGLYKPYADVESAVLVFRRGKPSTSIKLLRSDNFAVTFDGRATPDTLPSEVAERFRGGTTADGCWVTPSEVIASREFDLSPKRSGQEELQQSLEQLRRIDSSIKVSPLVEFYEIIPGISYRRDDVLDPEGFPSIEKRRGLRRQAVDEITAPQQMPTAGLDALPMLVRVGDVSLGTVSQPKLLLRSPDLRTKWKGGRLRHDDILITVSGTVGKIGVVGQGSSREMVPSRGICTLRQRSTEELLDARFIAAILESEIYQDWISGHSRGAVIQNLSSSVLRNLPVPIPSLPIQQRVAASVQASSADGFSELSRVLAAEEADLVAMWLEQLPLTQRDTSSGPWARNLERALRPAPFGWSPTAMQLAPALLSLETVEAAPGILGSGLLRSKSAPPQVELPEIEEFARAIRNLRNKAIHSNTPINPQLRDWLEKLTSGLDSIVGISDIPPGPARLSLLERAKRNAQDALPHARSDVPAIARARRVTEGVLKVLDSQIEALLSDIRVDCQLEQQSVLTDGRLAITVRISNHAPLALRQLKASTLPGDADFSAPYLPENGSGTFQMLVSEPQAGRLDFKVSWTAQRFDGNRISGEIPLSVEVNLNPSQSDTSSDLGPNPYTAGPPVRRPEMLYGREKLIVGIKTFLAEKTQSPVIFLQGNRRAGKSSILLQLRREQALAHWLMVYCDLQKATVGGPRPGVPTEKVFALIARSLAEAGFDENIILWPVGQQKPGSFENRAQYLFKFNQAFRAASALESAFEACNDFIRATLDSLTTRRLLLMVDEFDKIQEGIESGITSSEVPENIRAMLNNNAGLGAILSGSRMMFQMRHDYWSPLFGMGFHVDVTAIDRADAARLVTEPVAGRLTIHPTVVDHIVRLCASQPYLIQMVCSKIFVRCSVSGDRDITIAFVNDVVNNDLIAGWGHYNPFWVSADFERTRLLLFVVDRLSTANDGAPVSLLMIEDELVQCGVQLPRDELVGDHLKALMQLELIANEKDGRYRIAVPLFAMWMNRNKDYQDQLERAQVESKRRATQ